MATANRFAIKTCNDVKSTLNNAPHAKYACVKIDDKLPFYSISLSVIAQNQGMCFSKISESPGVAQTVFMFYRRKEDALLTYFHLAK